MAKADKATAVADITEQFKASTATLITEYRGLTVANLAELRRSLAASATYTVAKNTLIKRAASEAGRRGTRRAVRRPDGHRVRHAASRSTPPRPSRPSPRNNKALVIKGGYMDGHALTRRRGRAHRRPGVPRGVAGQAGRRDEGATSPRPPACSTRPPRRSPGSRPRCRRRGPRKSPQALRRSPPQAAPEAPQKLSPRQQQKLPQRQPQNQLRKHPPKPRRSRIKPTHKPGKSGRTHTMAKMSTDDLLDAFKELTLLELSDFVKKFEETFEVTAAAPVAVAAAGPPPPARPPRPPRSSRSSTSSSRPPAKEDRRHQGRPRDRLRPGPQGGQGLGRRRTQAAAGEGRQGGRRGGQGQARGRRRHRHRQVVRFAKTPGAIAGLGGFVCSARGSAAAATVSPARGNHPGRQADSTSSSRAPGRPQSRRRRSTRPARA